ncbi:unnamed protein product [Amoebophrya sp. A25]|nr:unnamed protein product [Amoebophrya sp. A25]|eukprot:GSA25T00023466001.1
MLTKSAKVAAILAVGASGKTDVLAPPTAMETRILWGKRLQELSALMASDDIATETFENFLSENGKSYANGVERDHRFEIFRENVKKAIQLNLKSNGRAVFGVTRFMDLTEHEFRKLHKNGGQVFTDQMVSDMMNDVPEWPGMSLLAERSLNLTTSSRDWRKEGVITPIKDQGQCGSCWAFSTVETVEAAARLVDPTTTFIGAPQELVSCDHNMDLGCNGGLPTRAYGYLEKNALESEEDYPYTSGTTRKSGTCKLDASKGKWKVTAYERVAHGMRIFPWTVSRGEKNMKAYILAKGPMSIGVDATAWQTYQEGILDAEACGAAQIDHAVQVVALNQDELKAAESGGSYWVVRNSWTTGWGEEGYIRLSTDENSCLITGMATAASVEKVSSDSVLGEIQI